MKTLILTIILTILATTANAQECIIQVWVKHSDNSYSIEKKSINFEHFKTANEAYEYAKANNLLQNIITDKTEGFYVFDELEKDVFVCQIN